MAKRKAPRAISPEEALQFLEDIRVMGSEIDEPTVAISLRVPANLLRALKLSAKADGQKYQTRLIRILRHGLRQKW
jgi:predicted DNA binding CopG/RHH family protein